MIGTRIVRWLPVALVLAGVVWVGVQWRNDSNAVPAPIAVSSDAQLANTLPDLVEASDVIVLGQVSAITTGRTIGDPTNPRAGITTRLIELAVAETLKGATSSVVVIEQESALVDGTPIVVDGVAMSRVGESGLWFLVSGDSEAFPYHAMAGPQGRFLADRSGALTASSKNPLSTQLETLGLSGLSCGVLAAVAAERGQLASSC